jgi:hypothetical protein
MYAHVDRHAPVLRYGDIKNIYANSREQLMTNTCDGDTAAGKQSGKIHVAQIKNAYCYSGAVMHMRLLPTGTVRTNSISAIAAISIIFT